MRFGNAKTGESSRNVWRTLVKQNGSESLVAAMKVAIERLFH